MLLFVNSFYVFFLFLSSLDLFEFALFNSSSFSFNYLSIFVFLSATLSFFLVSFRLFIFLSIPFLFVSYILLPFLVPYQLQLCSFSLLVKPILSSLTLQ